MFRVAAPDLTRYGFCRNQRAAVGVRLMDWARILAYVTGMVDQELLARNEYLAAENRILKARLKGRLQLSDAERATLGESVIAWAARFSPRWRMWPDQTPSWPGTASWWPANSMARRPVEALAGLGSAERSSS